MALKGFRSSSDSAAGPLNSKVHCKTAYVRLAFGESRLEIGMERCKAITDLGFADRRIHGDGANLGAQQDRRSTIVFDVKLVQLLENSLEFVPRPNVAVVMPCVDRFGIDLCPEASHDAEVMTSASHGPE